MFRFLRMLLGSVARGVAWSMRATVGLACDVVEGTWLAWWRHWCPPPAAEAESGADIAERVVEAIIGTTSAAERRAETERPAPRHATAATVRRSIEGALRYTTAVMAGETPPSLVGVQPDLCHELRQLRTRAQVEPMHRELLGALDLSGPGWWNGRRREVLAPSPEHGEEPTLRYA